MRHFKIPFDMKYEEKIIGGYLTLKQGLYAVAFGGLTICSLTLPIGGNLADLVMGKLSFPIVALKVIFAIIFAVLGVLFMYLKPHGLPFLKYIIMKIAYRKRSKRLFYTKRRA